MAASNTKFKVENGLDVVGSANVSGMLRVEGDLSVGGNLASALNITGDLKPSANHSYNLGNNTFRWTLYGSSGDFSNTLTVVGSTTLADTAAANLVPTQNNQPLGSATRRWAVTANTVDTLTANVSTVFTISPDSASFNANSGVANTTEIITTAASHGFANGDLVQYIVSAGNTAIGGLSNGSYYHVVGANATTGLQLSATYGGSALDLTAGLNQTGHTLVRINLLANSTFVNAPQVTVNVANLRVYANLTVNGAASMATAAVSGNVAVKTSLFVIDATNNRIGFNNSAPSTDLITITGNTVVTGLGQAVRFLSTNATHNSYVTLAGNTTNTRATFVTYEGNATSSDGGFAFNTTNGSTTTSVLAFNQSSFQYKSANVLHAGNFGIYNVSGTRIGP